MSSHSENNQKPFWALLKEPATESHITLFTTDVPIPFKLPPSSHLIPSSHLPSLFPPPTSLQNALADERE